MKILIACNVDSYPNPYVKTLNDIFLKKGINIRCSLNEFWNNATSYDIVHIQWPNLLLDNSDESCSKLKDIINNIKINKIPLICTCHNLVPHYNSNVTLNNVYKTIYNSCDYIHHLGETSIQLLKDLYPEMKAQHFVIPHHTYDEIYNLNITKKDAREALGIPQKVKCILSVGKFRHDEERKILIDLRKDLKKDEFYILAPGFFWTTIIRKNIFLALKALFLTIKYTIIAKYYGIQISYKFVPNDILPFYLKASDVMLIQRKKILNSGNVSLAMLAGLPIVGPNDGNVESLLRKTGNIVFDKDNMNNLSELILKALSDDNLGLNNYAYAANNLTTSSVVDSFISFYKSVLSVN